MSSARRKERIKVLQAAGAAKFADGMKSMPQGGLDSQSAKGVAK